MNAIKSMFQSSSIKTSSTIKDTSPLLEQHMRPGDRLVSIQNGEKVYLTDHHSGNSPSYIHGSNSVITSKYTILTFLPINLFEQFLNLANLYFLFIGILQIIPQISTTNGYPTQYIPLAFIVAVSAIRAAKEDFDKHKSDNKRNSYPYDTLRQGQFKPVQSGSIQVGDIVKVKQNDMIPADMVFLGSSYPKGHCFIDKSNLNGETRLEVMNSLTSTKTICSKDESCARLKASLVYEGPNKRFDQIRGTICVDSSESQQDVQSVDGKVLLMRETNLRNCDFIYGLVVYTGNDTKIQRSNLEGEKVRFKVSQIFREVNVLLRYMLILQIFLCIIGAIIASQYRSHSVIANSWYVQVSTYEGSSTVGVYSFFSWFILLSSMVPISLIVSQELVKFVQSIFIQWDINLYSKVLNKPTKCNSSTIHEDLGLIDYIFSDKTGTLTQNRMEFRYLLLEHGTYGSKETDISKSVAARQAELDLRNQNKSENGQVQVALVMTKPEWSEIIKPHLPPPRDQDKEPNCNDWFLRTFWSSTHAHRRQFAIQNQNVEEDIEHGQVSKSNKSHAENIGNCFTDSERDELMRALWGHGDTTKSDEESKYHKTAIRRYLTHMALSNTVKPFDDEGELKFQAESAEELAMCQFAAKCGFTKKSINPTVLEIKKYEPDLQNFKLITEKYNHVATLGFTNKRARVTVIYQRIDDGSNTIHAMIKGQDTVTLPLIKLNSKHQSVEELLDNIKNMAINGLRTLICGFAELSPEWWSDRSGGYQNVISRDTSEFSEGHPDKCNHAKCEKCAQHSYFELMEKDAQFQYVGCIGLEDQLQPLVPQTLKACSDAGIKVMILTGDKTDIARQIALACNLIDPDMLTQIDESILTSDLASQFQNARCIEITGQWSGLSDNNEEMSGLFDSFDSDKKGRISVQDLAFMLKALRVSIDDEKLMMLLESSSKVISPNSANKSTISPTNQTNNNTHYINKQQFVSLMQSTQLTPFQAVKYDLDQGIKTYNAIKDHETYPISILIDKQAFMTMFPGPPKKAGILTLDEKSKMSEAEIKQDGKDKAKPESEAQLEELRSKFFMLASRAKSVVFARAEPSMKKKMVTEIQKREPGKLTLAIGDGANDCDMIQAAHIGIGISGVEGTAATNSADYAIGTFRMLHTLLFVHGFYSYQRISKLVHFIFYKAALVAINMYLFGFFSTFSGQQFFNDAVYEVYNVIFTALPILFVAVLDKPLPDTVCENHPIIYKKSKRIAFTKLTFLSWISRSFIHAIIMFFIPYAVLAATGVTSSTGRADSLWFWSTIVFFCCVLSPTLLIMFEMTSINFLSLVSVLISIVALLLIAFILNIWLSINPDLYGIVTRMYSSGASWLVIPITLVIILMLEYTWRTYQREWNPYIWQIYQEKLAIQANKNSSSINPKLMSQPSSSNLFKTNKQTQHDVPIREISVSRTPSKMKQIMDDQGNVIVDSHAHIRLNMIRAMLRFRNLTGSQFDSVADAKLQNHDSFTDQDGNVHEPHRVSDNIQITNQRVKSFQKIDNRNGQIGMQDSNHLNISGGSDLLSPQSASNANGQRNLLTQNNQEIQRTSSTSFKGEHKDSHDGQNNAVHRHSSDDPHSYFTSGPNSVSIKVQRLHKHDSDDDIRVIDRR